MSRTIPKTYLPHIDWEATPVQAGISWRDGQNRKQLPTVEVSHKEGSRIYFCNDARIVGGSCRGSAEQEETFVNLFRGQPLGHQP